MEAILDSKETPFLSQLGYLIRPRHAVNEPMVCITISDIARQWCATQPPYNKIDSTLRNDLASLESIKTTRLRHMADPSHLR